MEIRQSRHISCLVDTDVAIDFLRQRDYAGTLLGHWAGQGLLAISTITQLELYHGIKTGEEEHTNAFLDGLLSIPVDVPIARLAGKLMGSLRAKGLTVGIADAIIAATTLELGVPLLTNNVDHYPFPGLKTIRGLPK